MDRKGGKQFVMVILIDTRFVNAVMVILIYTIWVNVVIDYIEAGLQAGVRETGNCG